MLDGGAYTSFGVITSYYAGSMLPTLSIGEVTYLLGYSEPKAFHRAFKRWHGISPLTFRAKGRA